MVAGPARIQGGGSTSSFPYPSYSNPNPTPKPGAPARMTDGSATGGTNMSSSTRPSVPYFAPSNPVGLYIGSGASADVANGDKVYKQSVAGGYYNNVYNSAGQKVASYFHANPTAPQMNDGTGVTGQATAPNHTVPTPAPVVSAPKPMTTPPVQHTSTPPIGTGTNGGVTVKTVPTTTKPLPTTNKTTPTSTPQKTGPTPAPQGASGTTAPTGTGQTGQGQAGIDSLDQGLFDQWNNIMNNLGNTNNPAFQQEVQGLAQQLNDKYYQQWLTDRDKMGGQGLGQSGFLNNDQLREQMAEQNDLAGQYGNLLQNYLKDQLSQATNYGDMMKTMMPYSNMTLDQRVAAEQNAQKLMDAQLNAAGYANINGTVDPTLAGLEAVGNQTGQFTNPYTGQTGSTLAAQKLWDQYNLLTPDQYATASGYLPSSYGGGPTLTNTNDALGRQLSLAGLTGMWNGQPTLQAQNDAQTRGNAAYGTQLSQDKGVVDTLGSQITSMRSANPADPQLQPGNVNGQPTLMQQYLDALNNYSSLAMSGGSGN